MPIENILWQRCVLVKAMFYPLSPEFSAKYICNVLAVGRLVFFGSKHCSPLAPMLSR